jgi:signal transduction histidine kinase
MRRLRPRNLSISEKLVGLIAILVTVIVSSLTAYLTSRQIAELTQSLVGRADIYGALLSSQLEPAIAFRDRVTAREVLGSLAIDPDVRLAVLCESSGQPLSAVGVDALAACRQFPSRDARAVMSFEDRVVVVAPVVSNEGPRGALIIQLSTARLHTGRRSVTLTAIAVGGLVLACAMVAAWLISRSIARRLRRIADVASAVTAGKLEHPPIVDPSADELGTLARAFNAMLSQLRVLIANVQEMARREQETLAEANRMLERRVEERTSELRATNVQLLVEMEHRSKIEIELRQAQKLESVGRLAAGIAHEINTPVQFVSDSVHFVRDAVADLALVVSKLQAVRASVLAGSPSLETAQAASEAEEQADVVYLFENLQPALERALEGLGRVATIVRSMKEFAHPDQKEMTAVDLNRAVQNTIAISRNEYKLVADVTTDFAELPPVVCHAGEVNQVVLNILVNAAHAIEDAVKGTDGRGSITVRTRSDGDYVVISIEDTGGGIPDAVRERVFDPFFTTKEVGRGSGQGLAIARSVIVDKHRGQLTFETVSGRGTTFHIRVPTRPATAASATVAVVAAQWA